MPFKEDVFVTYISQEKGATPQRVKGEVPGFGQVAKTGVRRKLRPKPLLRFP